MTKLSARLLLALTTFFALTPLEANALEVPILTWERGRTQEVVLGDTNSNKDWKLQLIGENSNPVTFTPSTKNEAGYLVYVAEIPANLPTGAYSLESSGGGTSKTIVAGINLVAAETYDIRKQNKDLTIVVLFLTFITVTLSSLRSIKYSRFNVIKHKSFIGFDENKENFFKRISSQILNFREKITQGVQPSLFRYLLGEESSFLFRFSKTAYYFLPFLGAAIGILTAINARANGGIEKSNLVYFFLITLIGLIDSFAGIFALFTFWIIQFFFGDVATINQILIMVAAAVAWIGPSLAARVYQDAIEKDFKNKISPVVSRAVSSLGSAIVATAVFYGGYKLLLSLLGEISKSWQMSPIYLALVFAAAIGKSVFNQKYLTSKEIVLEDEFELVRVVSPQIAFGVFLVILGFIYSWTSNLINSSIAALLFAAPYFALVLRFQAIGTNLFLRFKRNILMESSVAVLFSYLIYSQIQRLPQLSEQRAEIYLIAAAIPGLIHAIYSSICDSAQREERIEP